MFPQQWRERSALDGPSTTVDEKAVEEKSEHQQREQEQEQPGSGQESLQKVASQAEVSPPDVVVTTASNDQSSFGAVGAVDVVERQENCDCPEPAIVCNCARVNPKMRTVGRQMLSKILASTGHGSQMPIVENADAVATYLEQALHSTAVYHPQGIMYRYVVQPNKS